MAYQVILKRTLDPAILARVSEEVAGMSGASPDQVASALGTKSISIGKDFSAERAEELRERFEALGAEAVIKDLAVADTQTSVAGATSTSATAAAAASSDEDDDEEYEGTLLSKEEYVRQLNSRPDLFYTEKDRRLTVIVPFVFIICGYLGYFLMNIALDKIDPDFMARRELRNTVVLGQEIIISEPEEKKVEVQEEIQTERRELEQRRSDQRPSQPRPSGGGSARSRVIQQGVLGALSGPITGSTISDSDPFSRGGYASGIDAILAGGSGIAQGGGGGSGRQTGGGIGFGAGTGSGFGGGSGGVNLSGLSGSRAASNTQVQRTAPVRVQRPPSAGAQGMTGGRSQANIMRTVRNNMASLQFAYNQRIRANPGIAGKITVKWAIDEFGNVLHTEIVEDTMGDAEFARTVVNRIKSWAFGRIDIPGDVTEVTYPFVFTQ